MRNSNVVLNKWRLKANHFLILECKNGNCVILRSWKIVEKKKEMY